MRAKTLFLVFLAVALLAAGCESMGPKATTGAVTGGLLGAGAGAGIGAATGNIGAGAGIGAAVGAIAGGLIGDRWDKQDQQAREHNPNHMGITSIVDMASKGVPDGVIIDDIRRTNSIYNLDSETIAYLKKNKVSDKVIDCMLATAKTK